VLRRDRGSCLEDGPVHTFPTRRGGQRSRVAPEFVIVEAIKESFNVNIGICKIELKMFISIFTESFH
jgi:hypothetical protein